MRDWLPTTFTYHSEFSFINHIKIWINEKHQATRTSQLVLYTYFYASMLKWHYLVFPKIRSATNRSLLGFFSSRASIVATTRTVTLISNYNLRLILLLKLYFFYSTFTSRIMLAGIGIPRPPYTTFNKPRQSDFRLHRVKCSQN